MHKLNSPDQLGALQQSLKTEREKAETIVTICGGTGCRASESLNVIETLRGELKTAGLADSVQVRVTGCQASASRAR